MTRLDDLLAAAATRPRTITDDRLRALLGAGAPRADALDHPSRFSRRSVGMIVVAFIFITAAALLITFLLKDDADTTTARSDGGTAEGGAGGRGTEVLYFSDCAADDTTWSYDVGPSDIAPQRIGGVPLLELSDAELARLGVVRESEGGISAYDGDDGSGSARLLVTPDLSDYTYYAHPPAGIDPFSLPMIVSDIDGRRRFFRFNYREVDSGLAARIETIYTETWEKWGHFTAEGKEEEYERRVKGTGVDALKERLHAKGERMLSTMALIPIVVRDRESDVVTAGESGGCPRTFILWYPASPEVVERLPVDWRERLDAIDDRNDLKREVEEKRGAPTISITNDVAPAIDEGSREKQQKVEAIPTETGPPLRDKAPVEPETDPATTGEPPAGARLFPEPGVVQLPLRFRLAAERSVVVSIHDISGLRLGIIAADTTWRRGAHEIPLDLRAVPPGIYLLALTTDRGEQTIAQLIVR